MIYWNILTGVKHFHIYDPFKEISKDNIKVLYQSISKIYNQNYSVLLITDDFIFDCRKQEELNMKDVNENSYNIIISVMDFKDSNNELIKSLFKSDYDQFSFLPKQLDYFKSERNKQSFDLYFNNELHVKDRDNNKNYSKFYTRKNADYLPELILCFGEDKEICLHGYPFTLLENAEIINAGKLNSLDVVKYANFFEKFNKIEKRFGK